MHAYDYAFVRAVRVATGDAVTLGVVLQCRQSRFLGVRWVRADAGALALDPALLAGAVRAFETVAQGGAGAGPIGRMPPSERFHFLTAARSTSLQTSPVRTGLTADAGATLDGIATQTGPILLPHFGTTERPPGV